MKRLFTYAGLEMKRSIRMLPWFLGSILVLMAAVSAGIFLVSRLMQEARIFQPIGVAVVIPEEEEKARLISSVISNMDSVKSICRFEYTTEDEARRGIAAGELEAAIILGSNFYDDLNTGVNTPAIILVPEECSLKLLVFRELLTDGISLVQTTEAAVYAAADATKAYELQISRREMEDLIFYRYMEAAFYRGELFQRHVLSATGVYDVAEYYFAGGFLICVLMSSLNFGFLYRKTDREVERKLRVYGVGSIQVSLVKLVVMGLMLWLLGMCFLAAAVAVFHILDIRFFMMDHVTAGGMLLISFSAAAVYHVLYVFGRTAGGILVFFLNMWMILCSGILVPVSYLPQAVQKTAQCCPMTYWQQHTLELLFGQPGWQSAAVEVGIILAGILLGALRMENVWKRE